MLAVASKAPGISMALLCLMLYEPMKIQPLPQIAYNVRASRNSYPCSKQFSSHFVPWYGRIQNEHHLEAMDHFT